MWHTLFHLYGPFSIHSYGLAIAIGLLVTIYLGKRDPRFKKLKLNDDKLTKILIASILAAIIGGRALFLVANPEFATSISDLFTFWVGGYSLLGSVLALTITLPICASYLSIPMLGFLDLVSIYAPLLQSISRIGCFLAGCCYGAPTAVAWGVIYTDVQSDAPLNICIHPTQIYSAISLLLIFSFMYFIAQKKLLLTGQLTMTYFMLMSAERFFNDFWRGNREMIPFSFTTLSLYQCVAAGMFVISAICFIVITLPKRRT